MTHDVYGISIMTVGGFVASQSRRWLADLLVDPAGGTSWTPLINNLYFHGPAINEGGYRYFFPLFIKKGASIGMQTQCSVASAAMRAAIRLYGKPSQPDLIKCGRAVETYGADIANTAGVTVTPGDAVLGDWASIGTTSKKPWWWQCGMAATDISLTSGLQLMDVAVGDDVNKRLCIENLTYICFSDESAGKADVGIALPYRQSVAGESVYMRITGTTTPNTGISGCVYGMA